MTDKGEVELAEKVGLKGEDIIGKGKNGLVKYTGQRLRELSNIGMKRVDADDVRPPQILLTQKLSDFDNLVTVEGKKPKVGQYFHTGKLQILDKFECYFVYAAKSKYTDTRKPEKGELEQYKAVGVMDDGSIFGMTFRSSFLYCLSSLFSMTSAQMRPMFSIRVKMEQKLIEGDKGSWFVPVCRIVSMENNAKKLQELEVIAMKFDARDNVVFKEDIDNGEKVDLNEVIESLRQEVL